MKTFTLILFLISSLSIIGKSNQIPGDYLYKSGNAKHNIEYKLQLFKDGTFTFHSLTNIENPPQKNYLFGKGTWANEAKVITFHTNKENDINENTL
ncbi:hypothetical protein [Oceanihabitans sediminis]|uniref:Uncharacterized protein n=1 Tax=Oceanihabitans sediminis TaxID=1812012 RepID=A0A368P7L5_9FLAO|nr:hypothetical protein [Oceanihabitans sediminis]MDX1278784.1 hypothetical protein [Oceanihabitans sediminis]MDX1772555.1 hypothetical protein [Oceanihabitans sediminis]RBP34204.1 hypothetical protein DFR65_10187 [Oceanihabitans sediminis]RCU57895.1 hypothetical protein DU428_00430 [Oceanihabitans sediminis]